MLPGAGAAFGLLAGMGRALPLFMQKHLGLCGLPTGPGNFPSLVTFLSYPAERSDTYHNN